MEVVGLITEEIAPSHDNFAPQPDPVENQDKIEDEIENDPLLENREISELKALHMAELNEVACHFLIENKRREKLEVVAEKLQHENEGLVKKMQALESSDGTSLESSDRNDSGCEDRDYSNECYTLECEKTNRLSHEMEKLQCMVEELQGKVQKGDFKANEKYLEENLKLMGKINDMSIKNRQLSESLKQNELRENNFKTQILELEESVEKWRLKQRQSSSKISQKNVKIAEMTKMMEIMEMAANRKSRRIDVKSSHHRRGLSSLSCQGSDILLKDEKSLQGLTIKENPIPPISTETTGDNDNNNNNNNKSSRSHNNNNNNSNNISINNKNNSNNYTITRNSHHNIGRKTKIPNFSKSASTTHIYLKSVIPPIKSACSPSRSSMKLSKRRSVYGKRNIE